MATSSIESNLATAKTVLSTAASVAATLMLARSVAQDFLPHHFQDYFYLNISKFFNRFSSQLTMVVDEYDGLVYNKIYEAAETYLGGKVSPSTRRLNVSKSDKEKDFTVKMERNEEITDVFQGVNFKWVLVCREVQAQTAFHLRNRRDMGSALRTEVRSFEVSFSKKHKKMVLESYLPHIVKEANSMMQEKKAIKIFTIDYNNWPNAWTSVNLDHPATFDTLALDTEIKTTIMEDLERFVKRKDYYRKVGKAWKRGYLLYGPPGTGKSSLIAAMANYLNYDIYDLELTELRANSDLRRLLIATANRSILVVEDIDCTIDFQDRLGESEMTRANGYQQQNQVTLSGFLNFIDGLWSSCGDERIIVLTTNHKDKLDPALLRPGRMDVHVHMSYCTPCGFRILAANYLGITDHLLFGEIEELISTAEVTPAEVAEQLMRSDEVEAVLSGLLEFLKVRKEKSEDANKDEKDGGKSVVDKEWQKGNCVEDKEVGDEEKETR